ncbi:TonB family protein [Agaribacterium sp. ZY112]|uniref:TonB family protein n=1 Tax=Agaribacterium sp. ZY112 TaxID=3233574 RepID=UPI0035236DDD
MSIFKATVICSIVFSQVSFANQYCIDIDPIKTEAPKYPLIEAPSGHQGFATISFVIGKSGEVTSSKVLEVHSEPTPRFADSFGESALKAIGAWKFNQRQLPCKAEKKFIFRLAD